jgi:hypothetical protein
MPARAKPLPVALQNPAPETPTHRVPARQSRHPAALSRDPFDAVFGLDRRHARRGPVLGLLSAFCVHAVAAVAGAAHARSLAAEPPDPTLAAEIWHEVDVGEPLPAELESGRTPAEADRIVAPTRASPRSAHRPSIPAQGPPPSAAQAGKLLTAEPEPDAPLDLTGNGFVTGNSATYAGGVTAARGTAQTAVRNLNPRALGASNAAAREPSPSARRLSPSRAGDLSRPARPLSTNWNCGFPAAANAEQVNFARVRLVVTVGVDGRARSVAVQTDPGSGFGALARQCAYRYSYQTAHDASGQPRTATTPPFWVTFTR